MEPPTGYWLPVAAEFNLSMDEKLGLNELVVCVVGGFMMGGLSSFLVNEAGT